MLEEAIDYRRGDLDDEIFVWAVMKSLLENCSFEMVRDKLSV